MTFVAKKVGTGRYDLRRDGESFATLAHAGARWTLAAPDKVLVAIFLRTKFTADVTLTGVLWAIRSMLDFLDQRREADKREADAAAYVAELEQIAANARADVDGGARLDRVGFKIAERV